MTWKEFKTLVDEKLKEENLTEDIDIWYIDISYPRADMVDVFVGGKDGLVVQ